MSRSGRTSRTEWFQRRFGDLTEAYQETCARLAPLSEADPDLFKHPPAIAKAFDLGSMNLTWSDVAPSSLGELQMQALRFAADKLGAMPTTEEALTEEALQGLLSEIAKLEQRALDEDVPDDLRLFLSEQLGQLRNAVLAYRLRGVKALEEALERSLGATFRRADRWKTWKERAEVAKGFIDLLKKVSELSELARRVGPVLGPAAAEAAQRLAGLIG